MQIDRTVVAAGIILGVGGLGYGAMRLFADPDANAVVSAAIADGQASDANQRPAPKRVRTRVRKRLNGLGKALAASADGRFDDEDADAPEPIETEPPVAAEVPFGSGRVDLDSAREGFKYSMEQVDAVVKARRRLELKEWNSLYRQSNDAFAALSWVLDAGDEAQREELEAAHRRLLQGLGKVRVRGDRGRFR